MPKLNDLRTDLQENIDLSSKKKVEVSELVKKSTNDLSETNKPDIKLKKGNNIKISKNNTKKFDTFFDEAKEKNVDIVNPPKNLSFFL
ncbi:MAG: hypothetical protein LBC61_02495 [Candidatus Peribacteria bacterium]|jgi:hypothetical protein|nr:hypothetical protein [Candidatus Peribacteria bacterium]